MRGSWSSGFAAANKVYNKVHLGENIKNRIGPKGSILFFEKTERKKERKRKKETETGKN